MAVKGHIFHIRDRRDCIPCRNICNSFAAKVVCQQGVVHGALCHDLIQKRIPQTNQKTVVVGQQADILGWAGLDGCCAEHVHMGAVIVNLFRLETAHQFGKKRYCVLAILRNFCYFNIGPVCPQLLDAGNVAAFVRCHHFGLPAVIHLQQLIDFPEQSAAVWIELPNQNQDVLRHYRFLKQPGMTLSVNYAKRSA